MALHYFMIKVLKKLGIEGMYLNIIKTMRTLHVEANVTSYGERLKAIPLKSGVSWGCPNITIHFQYGAQSTNQSNKAKKGS